MKVLLGIGGGIAAYKSAELARLLMQEGHEVQAVMTAAAQEFVRPLTFAALTGRKVLTSPFAIESAIEHISVAQEHELLVIAPATADLLARLANGLANDFHNHLPRLHRHGRDRAGDERQHVAAPRDAGESRNAETARAPHRGARRGVPRVWNDRAGTARRARRDPASDSFRCKYEARPGWGDGP